MSPQGVYDFIIYCAPRVGAHMLASMLNSHPEVACEGEVHLPNDPDTKRAKKKAKLPGVKLVGAIVHYRFEKVWAPLVIHLTRDPANLALSQARMKEVRKYSGASDTKYAGFKMHQEIGSKAPSNSLIKVGPHLAKAIKQRARMQMDHAAYLLRSKVAAGELKGILDLTYEGITGNQSVEVMPEAVAKKVLGFLGLGYSELRTCYRKGSLVY